MIKAILSKVFDLFNTKPSEVVAKVEEVVQQVVEEVKVEVQPVVEQIVEKVEEAIKEPVERLKPVKKKGRKPKSAVK
jgi:hypothetical protein